MIVHEQSVAEVSIHKQTLMHQAKNGGMWPCMSDSRKWQCAFWAYMPFWGNVCHSVMPYNFMCQMKGFEQVL